PAGGLERDAGATRVVGLGIVAAGVDQEQLAADLGLLHLLVDVLDVDERRGVLEVGVRREEVVLARGPDLDAVPGQRDDEEVFRLEGGQQQVEFLQNLLADRLEAGDRLAVVEYNNVLRWNPAVAKDPGKRDHVVAGKSQRLELILAFVFRN